MVGNLILEEGERVFLVWFGWFVCLFCQLLRWSNTVYLFISLCLLWTVLPQLFGWGSRGDISVLFNYSFLGREEDCDMLRKWTDRGISNEKLIPFVVGLNLSYINKNLFC